MKNSESDPAKPSKADAARQAAAPLGFKIVNWIGIIEQLSSTRMRQILAPTNVPPPQFILLNHFSHRPGEGTTISNLAWAMQQPQPGITKTVSKLTKKGYLRDDPNPRDGRSKLLFLTKAGSAAHSEATNLLIGGMGDTFDSWNVEDMESFFSFLDRLKIHFDESRN